MKPSKLSILIPVYNEGKTVHLILQQVIEAALPEGIARELVIVNDASTDETETSVRAFLEKHPEVSAVFHSHPVNQGKGAALHTAIGLASGDYCIVQDADLEYDPDEYVDLFKPVFKADADVVYGSRFVGNQPHRILFFWHSIGNKVLTFLSNMFTDLNLTDMETCYKLIRTDILKSLLLKEKRFGFEPEVTAKLARVPNIRIYEVGISYYGRTFAEGKKINWRDGFRAIYCILKYNIFDRKYLK